MAITLIPASLIPETWYDPLNRLTASLAGEIIRLLSIDAYVQGTLLQVRGFSVNIIAECSAIHLAVVCASFIIAFPSRRSEKWKGLLFSVILLFLLNILRIAAITLIGMKYPSLFEAAHIYFGQLGMLIITVAICLAWCKWISTEGRLDGPVGFLYRFTIFSSLPFLIWIPLHRFYLDAIDAVIIRIYSVASYRLVLPDADNLHYHVFSMIALSGFLLAIKGVDLCRRLRWLGIGFALVTVLLLGYRLSVVSVTAFGIGWMVPVTLLFYIMCVYALPLSTAMICLFTASTRQKAISSKENSLCIPA